MMKSKKKLTKKKGKLNPSSLGLITCFLKLFFIKHMIIKIQDHKIEHQSNIIYFFEVTISS
jgi:hypothetical protein